MRNITRMIALLLMVAAPLACLSQQRSEDEAMEVAKGFWPKSRGGVEPEQKLVYAEEEKENEGRPYYYIFNRGNDQGFIIISGDSRTKKVLGYSTSGTFDVNNVPDEMKAWLKVYKEELKDLALTPDSLLKMDLEQMVMSKGRSDRRVAQYVEPLLKDINYSQSFPYNLSCPEYDGERSATGCVATGAVQLMRYYKYPTTPSGKTKSYENNGKTLTATYNTSYDWKSMLATYKDFTGSDKQQRAVAKLMYDAGVACAMEYSPNSSSARTGDMASGLIEYFGYDEGMIGYKLDVLGEEEFTYYLKRELTAGRPVLIAGDSERSGHCFVCDGYDSNGLFHMNWGWNGMSNGYFELSNLNPKDQGIGGSSSAYTKDIKFYGGIQPKKAGTKRKLYMSVKDIKMPKNITLGKRFDVEIGKAANLSVGNFTGELGIALYKGGKVYGICGTTSIDLDENYYYSDFKVHGSVPEMVEDGNYQMVMVSQAEGEEGWKACIGGNKNCYDVVLKDGKMTLTSNYTTRYDHIDDEADELFGNKDDETSITADDNVAPGEDGGLSVAPGEDGGVEVTTADVTGNNGGDNDVTEEKNEEPTVDYVATKGKEYKLRLSKSLILPSGGIVSGEKNSITAYVNCEGIDYEGVFLLSVYDEELDKEMAQVAKKNVKLMTNATLRVTFKGKVNLPKGRYNLVLYYLEDANEGVRYRVMRDYDKSCVGFEIE